MLLLITLLFSFFCYKIAKNRVILLNTKYRLKSKSLPGYYGINLAVWNFIISIFFLLFLWIFERNGYKVNYTYGYIIIVATFTCVSIYAFAGLRHRFDAQNHCELLFKWMLNIATALSIFVTLAILFTILFEAIKFFNIISIEKFILGMKWSPQSADIEQETGFGVIPVLTGTMLITFIAIIVSIPLGLLSAIYLAEYCSGTMKSMIKPMIEMLSGVPTVVYGYFAVLVVGPSIRVLGEMLGLEISTESALAAGIVMGIMIIPFILSLSEDAISAVPQTLRDAALALGSTKAETIIKIVLPSAAPGIISGILLAISRAIGETMIVTMAAGIHAKLTFNPFESVSTFTAQIVALLVGDHEFDSPKTLSAFALALTLFILTLILNIWALIVIKRRKLNE